MIPKKPKQPGRKASGKDAAPAQYSTGMAQLRGLLEKAEGEVSGLAQTALLIAGQIAALRNIVAANAPLAKKVADKMEELSQPSAQDSSRSAANRNSAAPAGNRPQSKKLKTSGKPESKPGKPTN